MKRSTILTSIAAFVMVGGLVLWGSSQLSGTTNEDQFSGKITALGSTALQPMVDEAGKQFTAEYPKVKVSVQGGGGGAGLGSLANGSVDIGMSDIPADEYAGIDASNMHAYQYNVVGIAVIVNPSVGVTNISMEQLRDIFAGKISNWSEVGGADKKINVINREESSGSRFVFTKEVMNGQHLQKTVETASGGTMVETVAATPDSIGYVAFLNLKDSVNTLQIDGAEATAENVENGQWKIWAYEYLYTNGEADGAVKGFIDYLLEHADAMSPDFGFIPVSDMKVARDEENNIIPVE